MGDRGDGERHHGRRHFPRRDEPRLALGRERRSQRLIPAPSGLRDDPVHGLGRHLGVHEAGTHRVHRHSRAGHLCRDRARETEQGVLGRGVGREILPASQPRGRRDVHHSTPLPLEHPRQECASTKEGAGRVDRHEPVPLVERRLGHGARPCGAGVVHQHTDRSELRRLTREGLHAVLARHVALHGLRLPAQRHEIGSLSLDLLAVPRGEYHVESRFTQRACDGRADPSSRSCHDRHATGFGVHFGLAISSASTASSRIAPSTSIVARPSSAVACAGKPKYARGPSASSKLFLPSRIA